MSCVSRSVAANICLTLITTDGQFNEDTLHPMRKRTCVTPAVIVNRSTVNGPSAKIVSRLVSYSESADVSR